MTASESQPDRRNERKKGITSMARYDNALRVGFILGGVALIALGLRRVSEKTLLAKATTAEIEATIASLDPATRAAVIARLTADAAEQVKERFNS